MNYDWQGLLVSTSIPIAIWLAAATFFTFRAFRKAGMTPQTPKGARSSQACASFSSDDSRTDPAEPAMILVCRDCHATVKFGEDCACGGTVELAKTQMDELLFRAWQYQRLKTLYDKFGPDFDPEEAIRVSAVPLGPAENAERASGAANISGEVLAAPQRSAT